MIRNIYPHSRLIQGSYYRRSSVYMHRRHEINRPPKLALDVVRPTEPSFEPQPPLSVDDFSDIVLPPKPPTPSITRRLDSRLADERHHTPL